MTPQGLRDRVTSVCATLGWQRAQTPFSFELQPTGVLDKVFRVESAAAGVIGGFNFSEERLDRVTVWVARPYAADPDAMYRTAQEDLEALRSAVIRDGAVSSGEYSVPDDEFEATLSAEAGHEFAVMRMTVLCTYETTV